MAYSFTRRFDVYAGGQAYVNFANEEDTRALAELGPEVDSFDTVWSIPVYAGARFSLP